MLLIPSGYCNSMINPIIYSFTVKEFKRSATQAILPFWTCLHGQCPKLVSKPPDLRQTARMARRQQQVGTKAKTPPAILRTHLNNKTNPKSAIATMMRGINATVPHSPLAIERKKYVNSEERSGIKPE